MKEGKTYKHRTWRLVSVLLPIALLFFPLFMACTSIDCPVDNMVAVIYNLQKPDGTADTLGVDTLWVRSPRADATDTLLVNRLCGSKATGFTLPISHTQPVDIICLQLNDTIGNTWRDTIRLAKENFPRFESVDCKASYFHTITGISSTHYMIDTIIINKTEVNYDMSTAHLLLRLKARR